MNKNVIFWAMILSLTVSTYAVENDWQIIAKSSDIYHVNTSYIKNGVKNIEFNTYGEINIPVIQTLKGEEKDTFLLSLYLYESHYNYISSLSDNTNAIIFLEKLYNPWGPEYGNEFNYYITNDIEDSIVIYDAEYYNYIAKEIDFQNTIINEDLYKHFEIDKDINTEIVQLINNIMDEELEFESFTKLENIGEKGVPYIILALDNFSELPVQCIRTRNNFPDAFEEFAHYGPYLVVDALAAILGQITHTSFGFIYNGDDITDEERIKTIKGWYIYLYYLMNK